MRAEIDAGKKRQAIIKMIGGRRLQKIGDSYAILLPKIWIDANAIKMGDSYYVKLTAEMEQILIESLDRDEINALLEANDAE